MIRFATLLIIVSLLAMCCNKAPPSSADGAADWPTVTRLGGAADQAV